ncbi:MAG: 6-phosphofructokinase [Gemmiger sp.]|uniref:6-phosphofructokinase n=1 Tax=Gemmiger sp. TaxID=2049027 RepID=UPI002A90E27D|nr:6-phosphofructokinase [Gemmiger sp.]MCI6141968.1 6-phosphofructokinase [Subdoligranulum variabile]MDD6425041.1 6-phosphofructokinase [Subdoligranulum variabile]MDD6609596.1 6-phosphofructokinase [Subdoligranulum variabile]MDD6649348.1 6-phosphofructokinase [Subdoligranulum variabile]MDY5409989.1 6-phosphofructokinase [Gemmiger sp.]
MKNVLVGQSGGPTAVINSSLAGVYETAKACGAAHVYGMQYGIAGVLEGKLVDLDEVLADKMDIELLKRTPSSFLGSCRYKLPQPDVDEAPFVQLFELFKQYDIGAVFYIGGNDSMDTISKLSAYGKTVGSEICFIGVPKTIDNDLLLTDHTPGYGSAAKYIATILKEVICDSSVYDLRSVTVAEIMGRHTGWLAAASSLAAGPDCNGPDLILLPERPFDEDAFLARVAELEKERHNVIIAASEGVKNKDGVFLCDLVSTAGQLDAFGHKAILSGTSRYLADLIRVRLGCKTRAIEFSTLQRCASHLASRTDVTEAYQVGGAAVEAAVRGETAKMSAIKRLSDQPYRIETEMVDVTQVANFEKKVPDEWITADGMHVNANFERYARPLIQAELTPIYINGVPRHIHLD